MAFSASYLRSNVWRASWEPRDSGWLPFWLPPRLRRNGRKQHRSHDVRRCRREPSYMSRNTVLSVASGSACRADTRESFRGSARIPPAVRGCAGHNPPLRHRSYSLNSRLRRAPGPEGNWSSTFTRAACLPPRRDYSSGYRRRLARRGGGASRPLPSGHGRSRDELPGSSA